jgi:hypothetical protein
MSGMRRHFDAGSLLAIASDKLHGELAEIRGMRREMDRRLEPR